MNVKIAFIRIHSISFENIQMALWKKNFSATKKEQIYMITQKKKQLHEIYIQFVK